MFRHFWEEIGVEMEYNSNMFRGYEYEPEQIGFIKK